MKEIEIKKIVVEELIASSKEEVIIGLEVPFCSNKRADIVTIGLDHATGYEIKSEHDDASRLEKQIKDYQNFFDHVVVICEPSNLQEVRSYVSQTVGILMIENGQIHKIRAPKRINRHNKRSLLSSIPFESLRKMVKGKALRSKEEYISYLAKNITLRESKIASRNQLTHDLSYKFKLFKSEIGEKFSTDELQTLSRKAPSKLVPSP
jgi:hypothetical protein